MMFVQPFSRWFLLLFSLLCLSLFLWPDTVYGCSCGAPPTESGELEAWYSERLEDSEVAFFGRVSEIVVMDAGTVSETETTTLDVTKMYKGEQAEQLVFHLETITLGGACGYSFRDDTSYLLFGYPSERQADRWETNLCAGNEVEPSDEILAMMDTISTSGDQSSLPYVIWLVIGLGTLFALLIATVVIKNRNNAQN